jgi:hypothetical protein
MKPMHRNRAIALLALLCLATTGCASVKSLWPWGKAPAAAPVPVRELEVTVPADVAMPVVLQFWERNTLVVDLQDAASAGQISLARREGQPWPARIGFRMSPSRFEVLEVRGDQRVVLPVAAAAGSAVTVELPPAAYAPDTSRIVVSWGLRSSF